MFVRRLNAYGSTLHCYYRELLGFMVISIYLKQETRAVIQKKLLKTLVVISKIIRRFIKDILCGIY